MSRFHNKVVKKIRWLVPEPMVTKANLGIHIVKSLLLNFKPTIFVGHATENSQIIYMPKHHLVFLNRPACRDKRQDGCSNLKLCIFSQTRQTIKPIYVKFSSCFGPVMICFVKLLVSMNCSKGNRDCRVDLTEGTEDTRTFASKLYPAFY